MPHAYRRKGPAAQTEAEAMRTQLAHFLRIPLDWNAKEGPNFSVILVGPAGQEIALPARKSDYHPWQWRKDANDAITTHHQPTTTTTP